MLDDLLEELEEWFRSVLLDFINANLLGLFTDVNDKTATIATEVGKTPQGWNPGIFSMVQSLSQNVIVPIAGLIISFVLCYELISMVTERNNMHDIDTWIFFKWIFKSFIAVFLVSNTFNITMAVFDIGQRLVNEAGNLIGNDTEIDALGVIHDLGSQMQDMDIGELMQLSVETMLISMCMKIISVLIIRSFARFAVKHINTAFQIEQSKSPFI